MPKKKETLLEWNIVPEYDTAQNEEVNQEIEIITNTFENVRVSGKNKAHQKVTIPITSQGRPARRINVVIGIIPGYPYVPPWVRLVAPSGCQLGDGSTLTEAEVETLKKEVLENIQPCLASGMPCMMQIASTVSSVIDGDGSSTAGAPGGPKRSVAAASAATPSVANNSNNNNGKDAHANTAGKSPSLTPVPLKAKDALKLSILTLHLLRKCCLMKDPESKAEANSNFEWLASYLLDQVEALPMSARIALPWDGDLFSRAFAKELQDSVESTASERADLRGWLWENGEPTTLRFQLGSEGRYQNEFIQQRLLGSGGFAPVYVCRKKIDGRLYAIKKVVMTDKQSEKIIREVQTLAALNHQNIVRYYDAWVEDGCEKSLRQFIDDDDDDDEEDDEESPSRREGKHSSDSDSTGSSSASTAEDHNADSDSSEEESTDSSDESWDRSTASSSSHRNKYSDDDEEDEEEEDGKRPSPSRRYQTLYIQMELCSARSLRHLIEEGDSSKEGIFVSENGEKVAASILRQLLSVTAHTHHENIVHRDLKPDNVLFEMVSNDADGEIGTIRVADFGLARVMSGVKRNTSALELGDSKAIDMDDMRLAERAAFPTGNCGSVLYCAPEQERGLDYDFKVDEFSIGMIALEMWLAIAGKGFRDRFTIMNEVWRTGNLPEWFIKWNPEMASVIGSLLEQDPVKRKSCEEVLRTASLPGDPADIVETLSTIHRYGERIAGRVVQKIMKQSNQYRKPPPTQRDMARLVGSTACTDYVEAVYTVGMLHGAVAVPAFDHLVPVNPELSELGVECVLDTMGRCFCYSNHPHFALASFLGLQENAGIGSLYSVYHRARPHGVFLTPAKSVDVFSESILEPLLSLLHLISLAEPSGSIEIVISHATWLNTTFPKEVGTRAPPSNLLNLRFLVDASEKVGPALSTIGGVLLKAGLALSDERDELVHKFVNAALDAIGFFGKPVSDISIILDPSLQPSETLVNRSCLDSGLLFECRTVGHSSGGNSSGSGVPFAIGCTIDNFTRRCTILNSEINAFCVSIDLYELASNWKHVSINRKEGLLLDGVAVRGHVLYSEALLPSIVESSIELWKGNIRACIRNDSDIYALSRALKAKHIRWVLVDGRWIVSQSSNKIHQNKSALKQASIPLGALRAEVRKLTIIGDEKTVTGTHHSKVIFIADDHQMRIAEEAQETLAIMKAELGSTILVAPSNISDIERSVREGFSADPAPSASLLSLQHWIRDNMGDTGIMPIYSSTEGSISFYVNHKRFHVIRKSTQASKDEKKKKKKEK